MLPAAIFEANLLWSCQRVSPWLQVLTLLYLWALLFCPGPPIELGAWGRRRGLGQEP